METLYVFQTINPRPQLRVSFGSGVLLMADPQSATPAEVSIPLSKNCHFYRIIRNRLDPSNLIDKHSVVSFPHPVVAIAPIVDGLAV